MIHQRFFHRSRCLLFGIVMVALVVMLIPAAVVGADAVVVFPDPNLEAAVREAIAKPTGDIYESDIYELGELEASDRGIIDLTGLEACHDMHNVFLSSNQIDDISPLSNVVIAEHLYLDHNLISDISLLSGLHVAEVLDLSYNHITNLAGLTDFGAFDLVLAHNEITDIGPLVNSPGVAIGNAVDLRANPLDCTSVNIHIPALQAKGVSVEWDALAAVIFPDPNLEMVIREAIDKPTGDIYQCDLDEVYGLDASGRGIVDLTGLTQAHFPALFWLLLNDNQITDVAPLSGLGVDVLNLSNNLICDIGPLATGGGLGPESGLVLCGNPLSATSISVWIPALQAAGVDVVWNCVPMPSLLSPANHAVTRDHTPYLDWTTVTAGSAVHYQLQVDNDADFSSPVFSKTWLNYSSCLVTEWLSHGAYNWRVRAVDASGNRSDWTSAWSFTVAAVAPPVLRSPANGALITDHTPYLDWTTVTAGSAVHYQLQVDNNADFSSPVFSKTWLNYSSCLVTRWLSHGTYHWRVRAVDASGNRSDWTAAWSFRLV